MFGEIKFGREFFVLLARLDEECVCRVAAARCVWCGGPLHRSDYGRKPRGGLIAPEGEELVERFSLCCGWEGCRKRVTPPSLRFLARRVYLGVVVIVASLVAQGLGSAAALRRATQVPPRTTRRWLSWWRGPFTATGVFVQLRAALVGVAQKELPESIVGRLPGSATEQVRAMLEWLLPLTAGTVRDGSGESREKA